jgi:hypothetical protein
MKIAFSINLYDDEGDKFEEGIYLHIDDNMMLKLKNISDIDSMINQLQNIKNIMQVNPSKESGGKQPYQQNRCYHIEGQMPALMTEYRGNITDGYKLRRLTPIECSRLQTIPEWYEWIVSDTQIYRMLGNGWTVEVIKHIFSFLNGFEKTNVGGQKNKLRLNSTNVKSENECSTCG